ncbi:MAG: hypothetical protein DI527_24400 [Chelatococcus sp.]|nr:MAG: hypothetical protein DI527_24400 [Chelatococcus sp.]
MTGSDQSYWFRQTRLGRLRVIHWKGWAAGLAFIPVAAAGIGLESCLKQSGSQLLYFSVMIPFGLLVLACGGYVAGKIDRR